MIALGFPQIGGQFGLDLVVNGSQVMIKQDVFRRNGGVGFQFEDPMAVFVLNAVQPCRGFVDHPIQAVRLKRRLVPWKNFRFIKHDPGRLFLA